MTPQSVTLTLPGTGPSGKATFSASVDADAGVTNRTVTWKPGNAAVATVDATGVVTAVGAGTTTITATSAADPSISGGAVVIVNPVSGGTGTNTATISIASFMTTVCNAGGGCSSVPANLQNFGTGYAFGVGAFGNGELDVTVNADNNGGVLASVSGTLTCGTKTIKAQGGLGTQSASPVAGEANAVPILLQFNTVQLDTGANAGLPALFNTGIFNAVNPALAPCVLSVSASDVGQTTPTLATATSMVLDNADAATVATTVTGGSTALDANSVPWVSGTVNVSVRPVLYSQRTATSIVVTLPNANGGVWTKPASATGAAVVFTYANDSTTTFNVYQKTLTAGLDANLIPLPVAPIVSIIDSNGNDLQQANGSLAITPGAAVAVRLDNESPQPPQTFTVPAIQGQWVSASFVFTGSTTKYVSCGDGPAAPAANPGPVAPPAPACLTQSGVSAATVSKGLDAANSMKVWAFDLNAPGAVAPKALVSGTGTASGGFATPCAATTAANGWVDVTTNAKPLNQGPNNSRYLVRAVETDKLGNARCTDLATNPSTINTTGGTGFILAKIGSDTTKPLVPNQRLANAGEIAGATNDLKTFTAAPAGNLFIFAATDSLSGFSGTPVLASLVQQNATGNSCVLNAGGVASQVDVCKTYQARAFGGVPVDSLAANLNEGYFIFLGQVSDLAGNVDTLPKRTVLVDLTAPVLNGIPVPPVLTGAASYQFQTHATDNLDLISSNFTLAYGIVPNSPVATFPLALRSASSPLGASFDTLPSGQEVLTRDTTFSFNVNNFVRTMVTTTLAGAPQNSTFAVRAASITGRVVDGAGNISTPSQSLISPQNIPIPANGSPGALTDYTAPQPNTAVFQSFQVATPAAAISISSPSAASPVNPLSFILSATATGSEAAGPPSFQFQNPFVNVSFYYLDPGTSEWLLIGSPVSAPSVTDNVLATIRTFTWTLGSFSPPATFGTGNMQLIAVGVNTVGDAISTAVNANVTVTNP